MHRNLLSNVEIINLLVQNSYRVKSFSRASVCLFKEDKALIPILTSAFFKYDFQMLSSILQIRHILPGLLFLSSATQNFEYFYYKKVFE